MTHRLRRSSALSGAVCLALVLSLVTATAAPVAAAEYPTWGEVNAARASESAVKALVTQIQAKIQFLTAESERTTAAAEARGYEYQAADQKFQEAAFKAGRLKEQADAADVVATKSQESAGRMAAGLYRSGGQDMTASLFASSGGAKDLLSKLGIANKVADLLGGVYDKAIRERNIAEAANDQADVAMAEREELRTIAEQALSAAVAASAAADAALAEQTQNQADLQAQLAVLVEKRAATERDYAIGEAARAAARAAAGAGPAGVVTASGWANPTSGRVVSSFGYRVHPIDNEYRLHAGVDLAGGCNVPIYAATGGRVIFSGLNGGFGNWILIDHGDGIQSGYAHIINGGRLVSAGQTVAAGQMIARTGSTGSSTGCHLHFEIRQGGITIDAVPFMRNRGVRLG
jgi:murein DD-endopeptidase MepM/ murein hydrolase activator NlpD